MAIVKKSQSMTNSLTVTSQIWKKIIGYIIYSERRMGLHSCGNKLKASLRICGPQIKDF